MGAGGRAIGIDGLYDSVFLRFFVLEHIILPSRPQCPSVYDEWAGLGQGFS